MKEVVVCGKGNLSLKILKWFYERKKIYKIKSFIPAITKEINAPKDWDNKEIRSFCQNKDIRYIESGLITDHFDKDQEENYKCDLLVVVFYKKIITKSELERFKLAINIHLSDLPKYRGARGINWALKNKEEFQGVTIHQIDELLDHGPIFSQCRFSIFHEFEEVIDVYKRSLEYAFLLFSDTLPILDEIKPVQQNHELSTYYSSKDFKNLGERYTFTKKESRELNSN